MFLRRVLLSPFVPAERKIFFRNGNDVSWADFFRAAISITADLAIVAWALAYIASRIPGPDWVIYALLSCLLSMALFLYLLLLDEFWSLVRSHRMPWQQLFAGMVCWVTLTLLGVGATFYGMDSGFKKPAAQTENCSPAQKEGSP